MFDTIKQPTTHHHNCITNNIKQRMQLKIYIKLEGITWKVTTDGQWLLLSPYEAIDIKLPFICEHTHFNDIISLYFNESEILTD